MFLNTAKTEKRFRIPDDDLGASHTESNETTNTTKFAIYTIPTDTSSTHTINTIPSPGTVTTSINAIANNHNELELSAKSYENVESFKTQMEVAAKGHSPSPRLKLTTQSHQETSVETVEYDYIAVASSVPTNLEVQTMTEVECCIYDAIQCDVYDNIDKSLVTKQDEAFNIYTNPAYGASTSNVTAMVHDHV